MGVPARCGPSLPSLFICVCTHTYTHSIVKVDNETRNVYLRNPQANDKEPPKAFAYDHVYDAK